MEQQFRNIIPPFGLIDLLDVLIVAFVLYKLYGLIKDTRAVTLLKGLLVILVAALISNWMHLNALYWLLGKTLTVVAVAASRISAGTAPCARTYRARPSVQQIQTVKRRRDATAISRFGEIGHPACRRQKQAL